MNIEQTYGVEKFAFVGPASVGKTTLTDVYKKRFVDERRVQVLDEAAEIFFFANPDITKGGIHMTRVQELLQDFVLEREEKAYTPGVSLIIADRSVVDPVIYTLTYQDEEAAKRLLDRVSPWLPTYSRFILLDPTGVPLDPGPHRRETPEARKEVFDAFGELFVKNSLPFLVISGSVPERVRQMDMTMYAGVQDKTIFQSSPLQQKNI